VPAPEIRFNMAVMSPSARGSEVLIAGAGPTGLLLALWLRRRGIAVRIIDKTEGPGSTSRALVVHARTLELYRQLGIAEEVVRAGLEFTAINVWVRGQQKGHAVIGDLGQGLSPYPYMVIYPQDEHERLLIEHLRRAGVEVERRTELIGFEDRGNRIVARLKHGDGSESQSEAAYLAGCDGAHSRVREVIRAEFPGGTYERIFYVADVELRGPVDNDELHVALDDADLLVVFPMKGPRRARLIGTVRHAAENRDDLSWKDVSPRFAERMRIEVDQINWFSTYRVHHRVARHFGRGRAFLAGDAAHVHSPVGGQGMNTGIGDAANLAWKLAAVLRGEADGRLLDSYQPERIAFARRLVATTDLGFTFATRDGPLARLVRLELVPALLPPFLKSRAIRRFMFGTVSQTLIEYRASALSEGAAGRVHGGDRLPWTGGSGEVDNYAPLTSLEWQLHVYGDISPDLARAASGLKLPLHAFRWSAGMAKLGLARNAAYLVRPDGYVASADADSRGASLARYFDAHGLRMGATGSTTARPALSLDAL
jgi:2-polyprenyl-6-methoxyphenol hydroxylase-like FAD-dependent oxidoreductase